MPDPLETPRDEDPDFAEIEEAPLEPTDVDKGAALAAEARVKAAKS